MIVVDRNGSQIEDRVLCPVNRRTTNHVAPGQWRGILRVAARSDKFTAFNGDANAVGPTVYARGHRRTGDKE